MPISTTIYNLTATPKFDEPMQYGWEGQITLKLNTHVLPTKVCAEIFQKLSEALDAAKVNLDTFSGSVSLENWMTEAEEAQKLYETQLKRIAEVSCEEGETARDVILREEQAKSYKIGEKTLAAINSALIDSHLDVITMEEIKEA